MNIDNVQLLPIGIGASGTIAMSFRDPTRRNAYHLAGLDGLDADDIKAKFYGNNFYNLEQEKRDVVARIQLNPYRDMNTYGASGLERQPVDTNPTTYSELRDQLYRMIQASRTGQVQLQFRSGLITVAVLNGFITKFESKLFEKNPEVQLTISCDDPILRGPVPVVVDAAALQISLPQAIVDNQSTAKHSFVFEMNIVAASPANFKIVNPNDPDWSFQVNAPLGGIGFMSGDILHVNSDPKNKELYLVRGATTYYLADVLVPGSVWPILFPGSNPFYITPTASFTWRSASYYPAYWGV